MGVKEGLLQRGRGCGGLGPLCRQGSPKAAGGALLTLLFGKGQPGVSKRGVSAYSPHVRWLSRSAQGGLGWSSRLTLYPQACQPPPAALVTPVGFRRTRREAASLPAEGLCTSLGPSLDSASPASVDVRPEGRCPGWAWGPESSGGGVLWGRSPPGAGVLWGGSPLGAGVLWGRSPPGAGVLQGQWARQASGPSWR